ncbi:response regulator [Tolypothrix sp. FACHB-123]|nr:response regulator [Tolypothrix sp. FACHB-123]
MLSLEQTKLNKLWDELQYFNKIQYSGKLKIQSSQKTHWTFYYELGQIVWITGSERQCRRFYRYITPNCYQVEINKLLSHIEDSSIDYWDYKLIKILCQKYQIKPQQIDAITRGIISEILFDIAQHLNSGTLRHERHQDVILKASTDVKIPNTIIKQAQEFWNNWSTAGLTNLSPHLAPIIRKPEQLQQQVNSSVYKNFTNSINGKYSLWDLAALRNQNPLSITRSLLPYIRQGIIELIEVPDLTLPATKSKNNERLVPPQKLNSPLIACIDDSSQICKILQEIITSNGMRFINIQDPVQALPILIQHKPDLIFLDLLMPVVNGYEICAQLRRSSVLANTPVVILTGSDGLFDKVRSKVFGATDFMNKPIDADKVLDIVHKYLSTVVTANKVLSSSTSTSLPIYEGSALVERL